MGTLTISTWIRLDAFFAALALWLLLGPRWVPQRPGEKRTLWIKLGVFFLVVHATLAVIGLGGPWLKAAMAAVAAVGSRELDAGAPWPWRRTEAVSLAGDGRCGGDRGCRWPGGRGSPGPGGDPPRRRLDARPPRAAGQRPRLRRSRGAHRPAGRLLPASVYRLRIEHGGLAAFLFILVAFNDAGAEAVGRTFGRRPFCSPLSPRKTVEGVLGGLLATAVASIVFAPLVRGGAVQLAALALVAVLAAVLGDLIFSAIKRDAGYKDFRTLLPAHGGLLDRFDSFLVSAACCHLLLQALPLVSGATG